MVTTRDSDVDVLRQSGATPANPFELAITKDALQRRIDAGDITRDDIEILRKSYTWISTGTIVGLATGIPAYFALSRRRAPPLGFPLKFLVAFSMSTAGGFLGFTTGGAAAAWEVQHKMTDAPRKLAVFQEIALDARRAIAEHRAGIPDGTVISHTAGVPAQDRLFSPEQQRATLDGKGPGVLSSEGVSQLDPKVEAAAREMQSRKPSAWDQLRGAAAGATSGAVTGAAGATPSSSAPAADGDDFARRQKEFDAMLERERSPGKDDKKW